MIKTLSKVKIEGSYLNVIKPIYDKPTAIIILDEQKLKMFHLRSGTRQRCLLSSFLFNMVLKSQSQQSARRRNKGHPNWKGKNKTVIFADDIILYIENPEDYTHTHARTHTHKLLDNNEIEEDTNK